MKLLNEKGLKCFLHNLFHGLDQSGYLNNDVNELIKKSWNIVDYYFDKYDVNEFYTNLEEYSKKYRIDSDILKEKNAVIDFLNSDMQNLKSVILNLQDELKGKDEAIAFLNEQTKALISSISNLEYALSNSCPNLCKECSSLLHKNNNLHEKNEKLLVENSQLIENLEISKQNNKLNYLNYVDLKKKIEFLLVTHKCVF